MSTASWRERLSGTPIVWKLTVAAVVCTTAALTVSGYLTYSQSKELLLEEAVESMQASLDRQAERLSESIERVALDAKSTSRSQAILGLLRARAADGYDEQENMPERGWCDRLERDFSVIVESKDFLQIRLIDMESGMELVRVNGVQSERGLSQAVIAEELQDKSASSYVQIGRTLSLDETFISEFSLNREHGTIQVPWTPTFRVVAPVAGPDGLACALLVINADAGRMMEASKGGNRQEVVMTNSTGGIIYHPQPNSAWGFEFGRPEGIEAEYALAWQGLTSGSKGAVWDRSADRFHVVGRISLGDGPDAPFLGLIMTESEEEILGKVSALRSQFLTVSTVAILAALILAYFAVRRQLRPILQLTSAANALSNGAGSVIIPVSGRDEIARLSGAFRDLVEKLQLRTAEADAQASEVRQLNEGLENTVKQRTLELESRNEQLDKALTLARSGEQAKTDFLAAMSHEIRTPMNGVIGMIDLLSDTDLSREQGEFTETIRSSAHSLLTIINDILDFSKVTSGKLTLEETEFDLEELLGSIADLSWPAAKLKGVHFSCFLSPQLPVRRIGDPVRLRQILTNLVGNAIKFTEEGEVAIEIEQAGGEYGTGGLCISIRDTGVGIPQEAHARLFECFTQADTSTTRKYGGTGLGLAISKNLVELMGGEISFESEVGTGTTFHFCIDLPPSTGNTEEDLLLSEARGAEVLVIQADPRERRFLQSHLELLGCSVSWCADTNAAAEALASSGRSAQTTTLVITGNDVTELLSAEQLRGFDVRCIHIVSPGAALPGEGGTSLRLPLHRRGLLGALEQALDVAPSELASPCGSSAQPMSHAAKVLLVDDNKVNLLVAKKLLQKLGHEVECAVDGAQAVARLEVEAYSIVFMDCQMPVMDGFEATKAIRALPGHSKSVPIIALTANAMPGDRERCLAAGMDDYLSKPIQKETLSRLLSHWLVEGLARGGCPSSGGPAPSCSEAASDATSHA